MMTDHGGHDQDNNVIDFSEALKKQHKKPSKKRVLLIIGAVLASILLVAGTIVFLQVKEVVTDKSFWQNFNSNAAAWVVR